MKSSGEDIKMRRALHFPFKITSFALFSVYYYQVVPRRRCSRSSKASFPLLHSSSLCPFRECACASVFFCFESRGRVIFAPHLCPPFAPLFSISLSVPLFLTLYLPLLDGLFFLLLLYLFNLILCFSYLALCLLRSLLLELRPSFFISSFPLLIFEFFWSFSF